MKRLIPLTAALAVTVTTVTPAWAEPKNTAVLQGLDKVTAQVSTFEVAIDQPIDFDSVDDEPVDLVVMLLAPVGAGADHLKALSRFARLLRTESVTDQLRRETDPAQLHAILTAPLEDTYAA